MRTNTTAQLSAYAALSKAADRMGRNGFRSEVKRRKLTIYEASQPRKTALYQPTQAHRDVIKAMADVMTESITPEQAMAVLHEYDVLKQRMGDK